MFRRHNRWHSRFDQPDPYHGSYSLGDPQSLNRYTYVQNDPVNFVDPSGLDPEECGPGDTCFIFPPVIVRSPSSAGGSDDTGIIIEVGPEQDPANSGGGTFPGHDPFDGPEPPKDCFFLQNTAAVTANRVKGPTPTVEALQARFVEKSGERPSQEFSSSGFKKEFQDSGSSPNQVRHYVGIMSTAYKAGIASFLARASFEVAFAIALASANLRERGGTQSNRVDRNLNIVAVGHAMRLAYGRLGIDGLAKAILDEVCDQNTF